MELSSTLWHSKLYRFTYNSSLPISLCPYFCKLVLAIVLFIPLTVFYIPLILVRLIFQFRKFRYPTYFYTKDLLLMLGSCCWTWDIYWVSIKFILKEWKLLIIFFSAIFICVLIVFIIFNIIPSAYEEPKPKKKKESSILTEFVKGKIGKYCPKINWY